MTEHVPGGFELWEQYAQIEAETSCEYRDTLSKVNHVFFHSQ